MLNACDIVNDILLTCTNNERLSKSDIQQRFGVAFDGVDYLIHHHNYVIAIKNDWSGMQKLSNVTEFSNTVKKLINTLNVHIHCIYISRHKPSTETIKNISSASSVGISRIPSYDCIYGTTSNDVVNKLIKRLYELEIYMFDVDGTTVMLEL